MLNRKSLIIDGEGTVAIYVRVSTQKDSQKDSPEHQKGLCEEKAKLLKLKILEPHYEDRDTGTSIVNRESIKKLIQDAKDGLFQAVIFASLSRFSRDQLDALTLKRMLVDHLKIRLISIEENFDSKIDTDEFKFQVLTAVNQKLSEQISLSSRRGIRQSALKGNFTGSRAPYGYQKVVIGDRKTIIPHPETSPTLKRMFSMYINGMGDKAIVNQLNEEMIPSYDNKKWGVSTVKGILQNPIYTGKAYFGKYRTEKVYDDIQDMQNRKSKLFAVDKDEWEVSEVLHEALIDEETFKTAQEIRKKRNNGLIQRGGARAKSNVFVGLLYCNQCNSPMNATGGITNSKEYKYLVCATRRRVGKHGCTNSTRVRYDSFRDYLLGALQSRLVNFLNDDELNGIYKSIIKEENNRSLESEIKKYEKVINDNRKLLQGIRKLFILEEMDEQQYKYEKQQYENELEIAQSKLDILLKKEEEKSDIEKLFLNIKEAAMKLLSLSNFENVEEVNFILKQLVNKITIDANGVVKTVTPLGELTDFSNFKAH